MKAVRNLTTTLYRIIESELQKKGLNEFVDSDGNLVFFDSDHQFLTKVLSYDSDVQTIVESLFHGLTLDEEDHDLHFKKAFLYRFINRKINRQTVEAFKMQLMTTFLTHKDFINTVFKDLEKYQTQSQISSSNSEQTNRQTN